MQNSLLVVGSVALDTVVTPLEKASRVLGGSAVYFSVSARLFNPVSLVAVVGEDFPQKYRTALAKKDIDLEGLEVRKGETFRWEGEYSWDFSDPQTLATHLNVFAEFNPRIPKNYRNSRYVFLANIDPQIQSRVLSQVSQPKLVACDTMNYWIEQKLKPLLKLLKTVDIFLLNGSEARELTRESNLVKAGKAILKFGPKVVVIKKGEHGVLLFSPNQIFALPAFLLETVFDPTGAGDTFAGGFMGYLAACRQYNRQSLRAALVYGTVMATFTVEDFSLRRLIKVTRADLDKRVKEFRKFSAF